VVGIQPQLNQVLHSSRDSKDTFRQEVVGEREFPDFQERHRVEGIVFDDRGIRGSYREFLCEERETMIPYDTKAASIEDVSHEGKLLESLTPKQVGHDRQVTDQGGLAADQLCRRGTTTR
jgi:hypothetical protein